MRYKYLVMDYVKGTSLFDYCKKHGPLGEQVGHQYLMKILEFLQYLDNEGISHRDLKLENILLDKDKNIKVIDFDFAEKNTQRNSLQYAGTNIYSAPELLLKQKHDRRKAEMYCVGVMLYIMVVGAYPFWLASVNNDKIFSNFTDKPI